MDPARYDGSRPEPPYNTDTDAVVMLQEELDIMTADRDRLTAEIQDVRAELAKARNLLGIALPHVQASAGAEHMLDGFRPRRRPIDDDVDAICAALANNETRDDAKFRWHRAPIE